MGTAIKACQISKRYRLGELQRSHLLREAVTGMFRRRWFGPKEEEASIWALRDVSFEVGEGEVVGIVGRNGAGKSTLLKILSRITYPTSGHMEVRGRVAALLEVGTGFHDELTGRENIFLNGSILGMKRREIAARLDEIVAFADVEQFLDTPIKRYSSGMRLRLGFAVAAHLEPDVLLVDEVLAVGDVGFQRKCLRTMNDLKTGGRTVLFVSHNLAAVENLCPRAIWVDEGRVQMDGPSHQVIAKYLATFAGRERNGADLRECSDRRGTGEVRYTRLEILDDEGELQPVVRSGGPLRVRLHYCATKRVPHPHFGIEVYTSLGTLITSINTWTTGFNVEAIDPGEGFVDVRVDALNLIPDRYYLTLWLASVGPKYDQLDLCATLDVEAADVHHAGREIDGRFGIMFLPCSWSHTRAADAG